jgi:hypothetical protein
MMKQHDSLENYERVKERKKRFYEKYEDGRIVCEMIAGDGEWAQFKASIFKTADDQKANLPFATGYAQEFKGEGGFANNDSWLENCEESAVGRALDNAGFSSNGRCSREEMEKTQRAQSLSAEPQYSTTIQMPKNLAAARECCGKPMRKSNFRIQGRSAVYCHSCKRAEAV